MADLNGDFCSGRASEERFEFCANEICRKGKASEGLSAEEPSFAQNLLGTEKVNVGEFLIKDEPNVELGFECPGRANSDGMSSTSSIDRWLMDGDQSSTVDFAFTKASDEISDMGSYGICMKDEVAGDFSAENREKSFLLGSERVKAARFLIEDEPNPKIGFGDLIEESLRKVTLDGTSDNSFIDCWFIDGDSSMADSGNAMEEKSEVIADRICSTGEVAEDVSEKITGAKLLIEENLGTVSLDGLPNDARSSELDCTRTVEKALTSDDDDDSESDEGSSSSSSSSSSEEEDDDLTTRGGRNEKKEDDNADNNIEVEEGEIVLSETKNMIAWSDNEDDGEANGDSKDAIRSKNELKALPLVPPVMVTLQPHHQTMPVGTILSIIGSQVIVEGVEKHSPLNEGSVLWINETRLALGIVDEIFGPVKNPYYIVRYNSEDEVPDGIEHGTLISYVEEFASHVLNDKNLYTKGYDASGDNDEELSDEIEFSDDEKEAEYRRMQKMKKRGGVDSESKPGNRRNERRQKNRNRNQTRHEPQTQPSAPVVPTSSAFVQDSSADHAVVPPFVNTMWNNGFPPQQLQNISFPGGLLANGMMWMQQNQQLASSHLFQPHLQTSLQLPIQQQQISVMPNMPLNFNMFMGMGSPSWPVCLDQNIMNMPQFAMGLQPSPVGSGTGPRVNQGRGGGRSGHSRGRGRFGGTRGRYQTQR